MPRSAGDLPIFRAAAAGQRLYPLDLCTVVADDEMANECPATRAGVGPLALILASVIAVIVIGVVGVIAAILVRSGWVRWVRGRLLLAAHGASTS
jgi:hypothetical protein